DTTILSSPPAAAALAAPSLRALQRLLPASADDVRRELDVMLLEHEPDHPTAARAAVARRLAEGDATAWDEARRLVERMPQQGKLHMLLTGDALPVAEELRHQAIAATLLPENPQALDLHASALLRAGRPEEARRAAARALQHGPRLVKAHCDRVRALRAAERPGSAFHDARARPHRLGALWSRGAPP